MADRRNTAAVKFEASVLRAGISVCRRRELFQFTMTVGGDLFSKRKFDLTAIDADLFLFGLDENRRQRESSQSW